MSACSCDSVLLGGFEWAFEHLTKLNYCLKGTNTFFFEKLKKINLVFRQDVVAMSFKITSCLILNYILAKVNTEIVLFRHFILKTSL